MKSIINIINTTGRRVCLLAMMLVVAVAAAAQNSTITGTVLDENEEPLIGASVKTKNGKTGVVTDIDGNFSISANPRGTLVVSYVGYKTQEVKINSRVKLQITLQPDNSVLDEVVVVGYGTMKKSDLTGSVSSVAGKNIEGFKTGSVVEALGGQIAGVQITQSDGTPGSGFDIKVRGVGTVNGDSSPLYIVDGFEVSDIAYIANSDIESIQVLKDASASAIYGARAANGVILVTTKSGKEGKPVITYNGSASYRQIAKKLDMLTPLEFVELQLELAPSKYQDTYFRPGEDADGKPYSYQSIDDYNSEPGANWQDESFKSTWSQNHDVSISGGSKETKYSLSFSHFDEKGIFTNSGYEKNSGKIRVNQKVTSFLTLDATLNYANTVKKGIGTSGTGGTLNILSNILRARPVAGVAMTVDELLEATFDPLELASGSNFSQVNPIKQAESVKDRRQSELWGANLAATFRLAKGLTFKSAGTYNTTQTRRDMFYGEESSQAYRAGGAYGSSQMTKELRWQISNTLTWQRKFRKHDLNVMLGHEYTFRSTEFLYGQAKDFPFTNLENDNLGVGATPSAVNTSRSEKRLLSFFARANYNYDSRYLLTATIRADGSTVFSKAHKWGYFPSFSAAWRISDEHFMEDQNIFSNLKLRAGWGQVGNDRITNYLSMDLYSDSKLGFGQQLVTVLDPKQLANKNLKWEGSTTTNVGLDLGFFNNRLNVAADFFIKDTKDLLLAQKLAYVTGFSSQWQNIGKIRNSGLEININSVNIQNRNFSWTTDFNISFIKNTLKRLQDGTNYIQSATSFNSNFRNNDYIAYVGSSLGQMYGYVFDGVYQNSDFDLKPDGTRVLKPGIPDISSHAGRTVEPGMVKYRDIDGDGVITTDDRTVIGNGLPDWYGGITNTFGFKGFDLSFMIQFQYGNDVYNANRMFNTQSQDERANQLAEVANRWTPTNASNLVPSAKGYVKYELYSRFIEDGSFLRFKYITLGYTFPQKWTKKAYIDRLRLYGTAQNLFTLTKYSGYDPEVNMKNSPLMPGFDWGAYPKSRVFTFGIEVQF